MKSSPPLFLVFKIFICIFTQKNIQIINRFLVIWNIILLLRLRLKIINHFKKLFICHFKTNYIQKRRIKRKKNITEKFFFATWCPDPWMYGHAVRSRMSGWLLMTLLAVLCWTGLYCIWFWYTKQTKNDNIFFNWSYLVRFLRIKRSQNTLNRPHHLLKTKGNEGSERTWDPDKILNHKIIVLWLTEFERSFLSRKDWRFIIDGLSNVWNPNLKPRSNQVCEKYCLLMYYTLRYFLYLLS